MTFDGFLEDDAFAALCREFPCLERFEKHENYNRGGQRPHNRYYLAFEKSIYSSADDAAGVIREQDLSSSWQKFVQALSSAAYARFLTAMLGAEPVAIRFSWHIAYTGCEVSPHRDGKRKLGNHLFYFNTDEDWNEAYGGNTLALIGLSKPAFNPDFEDFSRIESTAMLNNKSFLFARTSSSWHGVKPLACPEGIYRKIFSVVAEKW